MFYRIFLSILIVLLSIGVVHSIAFNYGGFSLSDEEPNTVSYIFNFYSGLFEPEDIFTLEIYHNEVLMGTFCSQSLDFEWTDMVRRINCEVPSNLVEGQFMFVGNLFRNDLQIASVVSKEFISDSIKTNINFEQVLEGTRVSFIIEGDKENFIIRHEIPKSVIELLTNENKNELILSSEEFIILRENPLIAWNIERAPSRIEYTLLDKNLTEEEMSQFTVSIDSQNQPILEFLKFLVFLGLLLILFLIFRPLFKKQK